MLEQRSRTVFRRAPQGGFVAGDRWLYFCFDATLFGYVIWGSPSPDDIRTLVKLLEVELERPPHRALVDLRDLDGISSVAFEALASYTIARRDELAKTVTQAAIVRPSGMNGATVAGFFDLTSRPFAASFWTTRADALACLGVADPRAHEDALSSAAARLSGQPRLLGDLQAHLLVALPSPDVGGAARELGLSARTLQRRLSELGTSFQAEVTSAKLRAAERRLDESDAPVTEIALDLGFATPQHFSTLFRRHTGQTPTAFRARRRD